jgi:3-isopropylmalate/(R)-2-methylmalate dehydratase small subunit
MVEKVFKGRVWVIKGKDGRLEDDIDTDMIFHNMYLHITDIKEMGQYAFDNLEGYKDFAKEARPGDIVIAGANFGAGSSRQQAVDCFPSLGVSCLICNSYGAIYKRNAINSGFPILIVKKINIDKPGGKGFIDHFDEVEVDLEKAEIRKDGEVVGALEPLSNVQMDIYEAGNIFEYAKRL